MSGGGGGGGQQIGEATNFYNQLASQGSQLFGAGFPEIQQLLTQGNQVLSGTPNAMSTAAEAPVNVETSQILNTLQGEGEGGPQLSQIALQGQEAAGMSADSLLSSVYSALAGLSGGLVSQAGQNTNAAAGGLGNIGTNLTASADNFWSSIFGDVGSIVGMKSQPSNATGTNNNTSMGSPNYTNSSTSGTSGSAPDMNSFLTAPASAPPGVSVTSAGASTPISGADAASGTPASYYGVAGM